MDKSVAVKFIRSIAEVLCLTYHVPELRLLTNATHISNASEICRSNDQTVGT